MDGWLEVDGSDDPGVTPSGGDEVSTDGALCPQRHCGSPHREPTGNVPISTQDQQEVPIPDGKVSGQSLSELIWSSKR